MTDDRKPASGIIGGWIMGAHGNAADSGRTVGVEVTPANEMAAITPAEAARFQRKVNGQFGLGNTAGVGHGARAHRRRKRKAPPHTLVDSRFPADADEKGALPVARLFEPFDRWREAALEDQLRHMTSLFGISASPGVEELLVAWVDDLSWAHFWSAYARSRTGIGTGAPAEETAKDLAPMASRLRVSARNNLLAAIQLMKLEAEALRGEARSADPLAAFMSPPPVTVNVAVDARSVQSPSLPPTPALPALDSKEDK